MKLSDIEITNHAREMMIERAISEEWVQRTIETALRSWTDQDGTRHFIKPIRERDGRMLHVVVNTDQQPNRMATYSLIAV